MRAAASSTIPPAAMAKSRSPSRKLCSGTIDHAADNVAHAASAPSIAASGSSGRAATITARASSARIAAAAMAKIGASASGTATGTSGSSTPQAARIAALPRTPPGDGLDFHSGTSSAASSLRTLLTRWPTR